MERLLLRPKELSVGPEAPDATRVFTFWRRTVEDFIASLREFRKDGDPEVNPKLIIIGWLSLKVYPYVEDTLTCEEVIETLKKVYIERKNNVYSRHLLASLSQKFLHALKGLAKECSFADVSAAVYREELTRDSFINGLSSSNIGQRLFEKDDLTLVQALELADSLDHAQRQSLSMSQTIFQSTTVTSAITLLQSSNNDEVAINDNLLLAAARIPLFPGPVKESVHLVSFAAVVSTGVALCVLLGTPSAIHVVNEVLTHAYARQRPHQVYKATPVRNLLLLVLLLSESRPVLASAPSSLESAVVKSSLESYPVKILIDSGASEHFVNYKVVNKLKLPADNW